MSREAIEVQPVYISKSSEKEERRRQKDAGPANQVTPWPGVISYINFFQPRKASMNHVDGFLRNCVEGRYGF